jgi:hypothetical protein
LKRPVLGPGESGIAIEDLTGEFPRSLDQIFVLERS